VTPSVRRSPWHGLAATPPRWALAAVIIAAFVVRVGVWTWVRGPIIRGDGAAYLEWAQRLAVRDLSGFKDYPLHQLYPMLIAPAYATGVPLGPYLFVLQIGLSIGTVVCLYYAARAFTSERVALFVAIAVAGYPALLFWFPYVLSETPFFFFLAFFLAALTPVLTDRATRLGPLALLAIASVLLLFARPVSIGILGVSAVAVSYVVLSRALGLRRARVVTATVILVFVATATAVLATDTPLRSALLRYPTVAQSLWLSTRLSSNSMAENAAVMSNENQTLNERFGDDQDALWSYKVREATDFISAHPGTYAAMALRRFTSYWMPALFAESWSRPHRVFDVVSMLVLLIGAFLSLYGRRDLARWTLVSAALGLGVLTGLSQIDTDGRYRMPAEIIVLLLAVDGYARIVATILLSRVRNAAQPTR
jgi:hypothetical protein